MGNGIPGHAVMGCVRKQNEQAMESKPVSNLPSLASKQNSIIGSVPASNSASVTALAFLNH